MGRLLRGAEVKQRLAIGLEQNAVPRRKKVRFAPDLNSETPLMDDNQLVRPLQAWPQLPMGPVGHKAEPERATGVEVVNLG